MKKVKLIKTEKILSPTPITLASYTINPYRGCEFGCVYCYAKSNKSYQEDTIGIKINAFNILEKELRYKKVDKVILGSSCECFTYLEAKYRITRELLEVLNEHNVSYIILTKSTLIEQYLSLIKKNKENRVFFTFNFSCERIKKLLESNSPSLDRRLITLRKIKEAGIILRVHIGPFFPGITDLKEIFSKIDGITDEVNIEIYHPKMGNFQKVRKILEENGLLNKELENVYHNERNYTAYTHGLKKRILELNKNYGFKIFYVVPKFNGYYTQDIDYEKSLI